VVSVKERKRNEEVSNEGKEKREKGGRRGG
jgi:hypothetical protein